MKRDTYEADLTYFTWNLGKSTYNIIYNKNFYVVQLHFLIAFKANELLEESLNKLKVFYGSIAGKNEYHHKNDDKKMVIQCENDN